jgi:hypothetical protein
MSKKKDLTERIMAVTMEIQENYPELADYVAEMTETMPAEKHPDVNSRKLQEYYDSLIAMVKNYKKNHLTQEAKNRRERPKVIRRQKRT